MSFATIRSRLLFIALLPATVIALVLTAYFVVHGIGALDEELRLRGRATVRHLAPAAEYGVISGHLGSLQSLAQATLKQPDVRCVAIVDASGKILALVGEPANKRWHTAIQFMSVEGEGWLGFVQHIERSLIEFEDFPDPADASRRSASDPAIGHVYVELSTEALDQHKVGLMRNGVLIALIGLSVAAAIALRIARSVSAPVSRLAEGVGEMAAGKLGARVEEKSSGELAALEHGFNDMAERLEGLHQTMQQRIDEATAKLAFQACHDPLTGLINRREFEVRVAAALDDAKLGKSAHALCYLDLDQFKIVNDTCGHVAGDELLMQLSYLLSGRVRENDTLARLGGDEFGVLLRDCSDVDALSVAESLREMIESYRFGWQGRVFVVGASIGMVIIDAQAGSLSELLAAADQACYSAKEQGRNQVRLGSRKDRELVAQRGDMDWAARISRALDDGRFMFHVQPAAPFRESTHGGFLELLPRLQAENGDVIPPSVFRPAAERFGLAVAIDRWAVGEACRAVARLEQAGADRRMVCLTLSAASLGVDLLALIGNEIERHGIPAQSLCFAISEAAASQKMAETMRLVEGLKAFGCPFCLDGFGSGLASFFHLRQTLPDYLRFDTGIVREVAGSKVSRTLVQAMHRVASELGVRTIAAGVDDSRTYAALNVIGIDLGQGQWFGSPASLENFCETRRTEGGLR